MTSLPLPTGHHYETLGPSSPAVVLGRSCPVTGERLRPGDAVVVCDARPGNDPITTEGWATLTGCPHCGVFTGLAPAYVPPAWSASGSWATPAPTPPPTPARGASPALVAGVVGLFLIALGAIAVAAFLFAVRTRTPDTTGPTAPVTTVVATATLPGGAATSSPDVLPSPTPLSPSKTPPPAQSPAPTPTVAASPTLAPSPTAAVGEVTNLWLINPATDRAVRALRSDDTIDMSREGLASLNFRADVEGPNVESVIFLIDGDTVCSHGNCVENVAPFALGGDQGGDFYDDWGWTALLGTHTIQVIACSDDGGTGDCAAPIAIRLTVSR